MDFNDRLRASTFAATTSDDTERTPALKMNRQTHTGERASSRAPEPSLREAYLAAATLTGADVLDRRGLAARWGVSTRSIARLEASGAGPRAFRIGRLVRWTLDEVRRFEARTAAKRRS
jgi:predicted DNA-binding transcriptional regulator AlpA